MSSSANRELVRRFYEELWNRFDASRIPELLDPAFRFRGSLGIETVGHAAFADYMNLVRRAFPDFTNIVEEILCEGNRAFARLTYRGTHEGEVLGFAPTRRRIEYSGAARFRFEGGRIAELWVLGDLYRLSRQLAGD